MNVSGIMHEFLTNNDCIILGQNNRKISFKSKHSNKTLDYYQLDISNTVIKIKRLRQRSSQSQYNNVGQQIGLIPEIKVLLALDLCDPRSLDTIRNWIRNL